MPRSRLSSARPRSRLLILLLFVVGTFGGSVTAATAGSSTGPTGYSKLASQWWEWALQQPVSTSPLTDEKGDRCGVGQHGEPWFLAGVTETGKPVTRNCVVPESKPLFFPVVNAFSCSTADDPPERRTVAYQRSQVAHVKKDSHDLKVWVDGKRLSQDKLTFTRSTVFAVFLPPGNQFGVDPQVCRPGVDSGYYVRLPALPAGMHTIRWVGVLDGPDADSSTVQNVTYHLKVLSDLG